MSDQELPETEAELANEGPQDSALVKDSDPTIVRAEPRWADRVAARDAWRRDLKDLGARLRTFAVILLSVLIDLMFLTVWVVLHQGFEELVMHSSKLEGLDQYSLAFLRLIFVVLTLYAVLLYVVKDAKRIFHRIWDEP